MISALDVWSLADGKGAPSLYRTLRAYGERGHNVHYLAPEVGANRFGPDTGPPPSMPQIPNVAFTRFSVPSISRLPLPWPGFVRKADQKLRFAVAFPLIAARRARAILEREPIDLLYAYEVHGALAVRRLQRRWRLPTVCRFQGTVMHPALDSRLSRLRRYEEIMALRTPADLYIMTDDGTRGDEVLARLNPASEGRVCFWRNGLDMERLVPASSQQAVAARASLGIEEDRFVLMTASVLLPWKRVDRAIRALALARRERPEAMLLVLGDGEERVNLEGLARDLGVAGAVRFEGAVPQEEVVRYLWAADVFLSLNDLSNVGNPLLEAMACGKPIITLDRGTTARLIRNGETGLLLDSGEPERVASALLLLARDEYLRQTVAVGARAFAEESFWTWEERLDAELEQVERLVRET
jgi:glycosyltransferase involved in cell wall biosynthesis